MEKAVYDEVGTSRRLQGLDAVIPALKGWKEAMPDANATVTNAVSGGHAVTLAVTGKGTPRGPLQGPSGTVPADHYLASWEEGVSIIKEVDHPAVRLTFDVYHHQVNEGNIISSLTRHMDCVGHIHLADVPGRHEPGTGEINFCNVLSAARRAGYAGYLGVECIPSTSDVKAAMAPIRKIVEAVNAEGR